MAAKPARKADLIEKRVETAPAPSAPEPKKETPVQVATETPVVEASDSSAVDLSTLHEEWPKLVEAVKAVSVTAAAVLIDAEIKSLSGNVLIVAFPGTFHRDKFDRDAEAKAAFLDAARSRWGQSLRLKLQLLSDASAPSEAPEVKTEHAEDIIRREPIVKAALEIFGGEIVEIKDAPFLRRRAQESLMMKGMGNMGGMLKKVQKIQGDMAKLQEELLERTVEGSAGGGAVTVVMTGGHIVQSIKIDKDLVDPDDVEMLEIHHRRRRQRRHEQGSRDDPIRDEKSDGRTPDSGNVFNFSPLVLRNKRKEFRE